MVLVTVRVGVRVRVKVRVAPVRSFSLFFIAFSLFSHTANYHLREACNL